MADTTATLAATVDRLTSILQEKGNKPGGVNPRIVFGDKGAWDNNWRSDQWPTERLEKVSKAYGGSVPPEFYYKGNKGRPTASGLGPALIKMAAIAGNQDALASGMAQGLIKSRGYTPDNLESEHGFISVVKAAQSGIPWAKGPDGQVRKTALAESSGQTGGYIIPPQFMTELLTIEAEEGFILQRAKTLPMNTRTVEWPMLDITTVQAAGTSPYFGGILATWQPEAATINETEPQFKQSTWTAWDLVLYAVSSNQLLADNGIGLDALLTQLFGQAIVWYKEFAFLQGKGAGSTMPLGVLNAPATILQTRGVSGRFKFADAAAMMAHLQIRSWDDACWVMHQSVLPELIQMVDNSTSNRLVWMSPMGDASSIGPAGQKLPKVFLNSLPVFFTEKLPTVGNTGDVMLVDWSKYVIGQRLDMQIDVSPHYLFRNNQLAWRVVARADGKPWLNNVITDQAGWQLSPFIVLK